MALLAQEGFVFELLSPFFSEKGYECLPEYKQFRKHFAGGFQCVILSMSAYERELWIEVNLGIRIDAIEQLVHQFVPSLSLSEAQNNTAVISVGKLIQQPYFRYKADSQLSLAKRCREIALLMGRQGFDFLETYNSMEALHYAFNEKPEEATPLAHNLQHRCFRGLLLAKMIAPAQMPDLEIAYQHYLYKQKAPAALQEAFQRLINFLRFYSPN